MAFTVSTIVKGMAFGNQFVHVMNVTADASTGTVETGLRSVLFTQVGPVSAPTMPNIMENKNASGVATLGTIGMSNCTTGNIYRVIAYGA